MDIAERLLDTAEARLRAAGLGEQIITSQRASATALTHLAAATCDVVLFLGPLYHLCTLPERKQAVREAARVLKSGGLLVAIGINRLAYLRDQFRFAPHTGIEREAFHAQFMQDGNLDPDHAPPIGYAHLSTSAEFRALFATTFAEVALVGVDAFTAVWQDVLPTLTPDNAEAWLKLVEQTGRTADGLGMSDHFLYIGRKD